MQRAGRPRDSSGMRGIAASLCLHLALLGALLALSGIDSLPPPPEESIAVELVGPEQAEPPAPPVAAPEPAAPAPVPASPEGLVDRPAPVTPPAATPPEAAPALAPEPPAMITAQRLFSESVLANPRSRQARQALAQLEGGERIEQLCNLEAMSQIHAWKADFEPDRVVAYAMTAIKPSRAALQADGAAFRSHRLWYNLKFRCELAPGGTKVAGFQFQVGEPVPRGEWAAHDLPPVH